MKYKTHMILTLDDLSDMNPTDPGYKSFCRGKEAYDSRNYEEAVRCFKHAICSVPNFAVAYDYLALAYQAIDDHEEAERSICYASECRAKGTS